MKKITELEKEEKYYDICMYLIEKYKEEPKLLLSLYDIDSKTDFSKTEIELLNKAKSFLGTAKDWVYLFSRDAGFLDIRKSGKNKAIIKQIEKSLSILYKKKAIILTENEWSEVKLDHPDDELPKVKVVLSFDKEFFMIKAEVHDNHFLDGNRSWRYGDGFYLTFAMPDESEKKKGVDTTRFYNLGFSMEEGEPKAVLVNHNGKYYLRSDLDFPPEIDIDKKNMKASYRIKIPFSFLKPFDVLIDEESGFYIRYVSQQEGDQRKYVTLFDDFHADSEYTKYRRFVPVSYSFRENSPFRLAGVMDNRLVSNDILKLNIKTHAPKELTDVYSIQISDSNGKSLLEIKKDVSISKGLNSIEEKIVLLELDAGLYNISVTIKDEIWVSSFYKFKDADLKKIENNIKELIKQGDTIQNLNSVHTIEYLLQQAKKQIAEFHPRDDPSEIFEMLKNINDSIKNCFKNKSIFTKSGYALAAIKSPFDNSLQPYSMFFPKDFDPENEFVLLVSLHGSGVDEVGFVNFVGRNLEELGISNLILLGPRGRHLSDHYAGQSENDVVDIITNAKKMFKISKTLIFGFSMGGYGTWRMTLKHPELFDGAFIAAGFPKFGSNEEDDMSNFIGKVKNIDYFVVHGTADRSVSIKSTDEFIKKLKNAGYSIQYERVEGQDHGNLSIEKYIVQWLQMHLE